MRSPSRTYKSGITDVHTYYIQGGVGFKVSRDEKLDL